MPPGSEGWGITGDKIMLKNLLQKLFGYKKQKAQELPDHGWLIREIEITEGAGKIDPKEFEDMPELSSLHIPGSIQYIGSEAFKNTPNLHSISYGSIIEDWWTFVKKAPDWQQGSSLREINCRDGNIVLDLPINF